MNHRGQILSLMAAWGYAPESIGEVRAVLDVYRVETADGPKNLKWTRHSDEMLLFVISALRHLEDNGFHHLRLPLATVDGTPFLVRDGEHYLLSDWIDGHQVDVIHPEQLAGSCRTLAYFHRASRGFRPPDGINVRQRWGELHYALGKRCHELEQFPRLAAKRGRLTGFDRAVAAETEYYLALANFARDMLAKSSYRPLAAKAALEGSLCHGDVAARNFLVTPKGEVCLIDFDGLCQDLPLIDLWKFLRRAMKSLRWDTTLGLRILEAYESVTPFTSNELEVLLALVSFPQKFWRLANRYYGGRYRVEEDRFLRKLQRCTLDRQAHAEFLGELVRLCRERGAHSDWPPSPFTAAPLRDGLG